MERIAPVQSATPLAARRHSRPDARMCGGEISFEPPSRFRGNVPHTFILAEAGLLAVVFRKSVGPRDAAWGPVGPSVGQWTCVSRPEATGRLYHSRQSSGPLGRQEKQAIRTVSRDVRRDARLVSIKCHI